MSVLILAYDSEFEQLEIGSPRLLVYGSLHDSEMQVAYWLFWLEPHWPRPGLQGLIVFPTPDLAPGRGPAVLMLVFLICKLCICFLWMPWSCWLFRATTSSFHWDVLQLYPCLRLWFWAGKEWNVHSRSGMTWCLNGRSSNMSRSCSFMRGAGRKR